ncbi:cytidine deaminase [Bauldia sp.]|uniref:cytidine deaminase n=1 Tax=Bauldia sp. TaxID=2575872 RepID=UPI003BA93F4F
MADRELFEAARAVRSRAHVPYSRYAVGTAIRTEAGTVHVGCNVENASFPEGWCSETTAIAAMVVASDDPAARRIVEVQLVADPIDGRLTTPCGGCRQRLAEFGMPGTLIHVSDPEGRRRQTHRLADLLPEGFAMSEAV